MPFFGAPKRVRVVDVIPPRGGGVGSVGFSQKIIFMFHIGGHLRGGFFLTGGSYATYRKGFI